MKRTLKNVTICSMLGFMFFIMCCAATVEAGKMTSADQAQRAALKTVPSATVVKVESDYDNGTQVYEVELVKGGKEYNFEYRASDGKLIQYDWEISNPPYTNQSRKNIPQKSIQKKAKKKVKNAAVLGIVLKHDDGRAEYKVKLRKGNKNYTLVYDSKSGKLLEYEWEIVSSGSASAKNKDIGLEKAKAIAMKKAPGATVVKAKADDDDGIKVYEIEMVKGIYEYEVKIDARTGKVLEFEKDIDD